MWHWRDINFKSPINGEIKVKFFLGHPAVWVGGGEQSGPLVEQVWSKALKGVPLRTQGDPLRNVLVLGLGCGTVAKLISKKFPQTKITGVEIDPVMVEIGKKYFGLDELKNLKIIIGDALRFLGRTRKKYDVIIVDAYLGKEAIKVPVDRLSLAKNGIALINIFENDKNTIRVVKLCSSDVQISHKNHQLQRKGDKSAASAGRTNQ